MRTTAFKPGKITHKVILIFIVMILMMVTIFLLMQATLRKQNLELLAALKTQFIKNAEYNLSVREDVARLYLHDNTAWDELVSSIQRGDTAWIRINIGIFSGSYNFSNLYIFSPGSDLLYHQSSLQVSHSEEFPFPTDSIPFIFKDTQFVRFFWYNNGSLTEYIGATVVPSANILDRKSKPFGYFFVTKPWDSTYLSSLEKSTEATVFITTAMNSPVVTDAGDMHTRILLPGYHRKMEAVLNFVKHQETLTMTLKRSRLVFVVLMTGLFFSLILIWLFIHHQISKPVATLADSLENLDNKGLDLLSRRDDELSLLAVRVKENIELRKKLGEELAEKTIRQKQLHELNVTKDRIFSIIGHDLVGPFNTISGFSELLENTANSSNPAKVKEFARMIRTTSRDAYHILETLLTWGRMQTGMIQYKPENIDVNELLRDSIILARSQAKLKNIHLTFKESQSAIAYADYNMIHTVIRNLLSNAIKFTAPDGTVELRTFERGNGLCIEVRDSGVGMTPEKLRNLFVPEKSESSRGTANEKGTGLGLILCAELVRKNLGEIWVESEECKGTSFFITLPVS
ncbi:MAG: ATP-binding protein [Bacteroidales bacterium]